jgi:DNA-binding SARP family transcriptional activator/tetratricopeptide (TPR) repeat protein
MLRNSEFRLLTLGRLALLTPSGTEEESLATRRRKIALLAVLVRSRRPINRNALAEMFWGDQPEERARHSLSDALSHLRRVLGKDALSARQEEVSLAADFPLTCDASALEAAMAAGDFGTAVELYQGPFLAGLHVDNSNTFDTWHSAEQAKLAALFIRAAEQVVRQRREGSDAEGAASVAERWVDADPLSQAAAVAWLEALGLPGSPESDRAVLAAYERLEQRLKRDFDLAPAEPVARLAREAAERIRARAATEPVEIPVESFAGLAPSAAVSPVRRWRLPVALLALLAIGIGLWWLGRAREVIHRRPVFAVTAIRNVSGDSTSQWLADGLPQMIAAELSQSSEVDVIAPERLREIRTREGKRSDADLTAEQLLDLARRAGATQLVTGGLVRGDTALVLDLTIHDVQSGSVARLYTVVNADALQLADLAAARLLDAANVRSPGMHLAELETSSLEAYQHFVRAYQVGSEGRLGERRRELDAAVALDSGFISAIRDRQSLALTEGDGPTFTRLSALFNRYRARASDWDRLNQDVQIAYHTGERGRSEALGEELIRHFPMDPRGYMQLDQIYLAHGRFDLAEGVLARALALDSLALEAGHGPCAPCVSYSGLADIRAIRGDLPGAEQAARRWIELQPDLPGPWAELSTVLSFAGRFDEAIEAARRSATLSGGDVEYLERIGRTLLMARRYASVDSIITVWSTDARPAIRTLGADLKAMLQRERGEYRASSATIEQLIADDPPATSLRLEEANSLGRVGDYAGVRRVFGTIEHWPGAPIDTGLVGDQARAYCWHHALEAAALAGSGDTVMLRAWADSIRRTSEHSYYGRDWRLHHHLLGLVALIGRRYPEAAAQLDSARWTATGWTETNAALAQADLALGKNDAAIEVLRQAYQAPLDAMGRYEPRSELDFLMAKAFAQAGRRDSAAVYAARVEEAWRRADPEVRRRLSEL